MKKLLLTTLGLLLLLPIAFSKPVAEADARKAAQTFLSRKAAGSQHYHNETLNLINDPALQGYFLFELSNRNGFILIAADDAAYPVLGYSLDEPFEIENPPIQVKKWLDNYSDQIEFIQRNSIQATPEITQQWNYLLNPPATNVRETGTQAVSPLVTVTWDQAPYYNRLCPPANASSDNNRAVTGCVATAMAQIMKYHNYPTKGTGFHSYSHPTYGTLSANFGNTTYDWGNMPANVTATNNAVATLMYHCGVSVDMNYGLANDGGSGAYPSAIDNAFEDYFGYSTTAQEVNRSSYTESSWIAMLKAEFDAGRPVEYHGFGNGGGHSFVCDGYDNSNLFHFNWGWGGVANGYYGVNALNPTELGYGGGLGSYNSNQGAIIGIKPPAGGGGGTYALELNSTPTFAVSPIYYEGAATLNVNIRNTGTGAFSGELAAALFNSSGVFVQYIETKTGVSISASGSNAYAFANGGLGSSATPGTYSAYLYFKPTGGSWTAINGGSYTNLATLVIQSQASTSSGLSMATSLSSTPATVGRNAAFDVDVDITNNDVSSYNGDLAVDIYDFEYNWLGTVEELNSVSIGAGNTSSFTFSSSGMDIPGGTYLMVLWYWTGSEWDFVGEDSYSNPEYITFSEGAPGADIYESNNSSGSAYDLSTTITDGTTIDTDGSNLHIGSDLDYYYVSLPSNDYSIDARIHDSYNSDNGNTYTADVMFSYDDGSGLSDSYDDVMPNYIHVYGGGDVEFLVAPYFTGEVGSYILEMTVYEGIVDAFKDPSTQSRNLVVFPNPTKGNISFEIPSNTIYSGIKVVNAQGIQVHETTQSSGSLSLEFLPDGLYTLELLKLNGVSDHAKVTIQK